MGNMAVLIIRAHKRFAACRAVRIHGEGGGACEGLLIELSQEGCRISNVDLEEARVDTKVRIDIEGWHSLDAQVRWRRDRIIGFRLLRPLHTAELAELLTFCRQPTPVGIARRA